MLRRSALGQAATLGADLLHWRNSDTTGRQVVRTVTDFGPLWEELFPADACRGAPVTGGRSGVSGRRKISGQNWEFDGTTITVRIPTTWKRCGGRKVIIAPDGGDAWTPAKLRPDETLIRALARAHRWKQLLDAGRYCSALVEAEGVTRSFANRLLWLTLLAPDIVEAILVGRQPKGLQLEDLTRVMLTT